MTRFLVVGFALVMSAVSVAKFYANGERGRLLAKQHEIADLRNMDWKAFERLVGEAYRRAGFVVTENGRRRWRCGPDFEERKSHVHCAGKALESK
jgi:restriction system protein